MNSFELLVFGAVLGFIAVVPPGPISLTLIEIGSAQGRRGGVRAGLGVAGGEALVTVAAVTIVAGLGQVIPALAFTTVQVFSGIVIVAIGLVLLARPEICQSLVVGIRRPGTTMFLITVATPTVLGSWVALLAALPMSDDAWRLAAVGLGGAAASLGWHLALGVGAGSLGPRLSAPRRTAMTQAGGVAMVTLGLSALFTVAQSWP